MGKKNHIEGYLRKWKIRNTAIIFLLFLLYALLIISIDYLLLDFPLVYLISTSVLFTTAVGILFYNRIPKKTDAKRFLHEKYPSLEFSLSLLEENDSNLLPLQLLQKRQIERIFSGLDLKLPSVMPLVTLMAWLGGVFLVGALLVGFISFSNHEVSRPNANDIIDSHFNQKSKDGLKVSIADIKIVPPNYTGKKIRNTGNPHLQISEGSSIVWKMDVVGNPDSVVFEFGDEAKQLGVNKTIQKSFRHSNFYRYKLLDSVKSDFISDYARIEVYEDQKPEVDLMGIPEYQILPWKDNYTIDFQIKMSDDYGLEDAYISATVAKGSGESVQFREKEFPLNNFLSGRRTYSGSYSFFTDLLEMEPGSELYFYVRVKDNCPYRTQATKSLTHFVVIEDTVSYNYFEDSGMQADLMPEFFRSQRQIIIDTEKLIAERKNIPKEEFNNRSNELGFDQKMLRLKYGQFLGEESESGIAIENEIEEDHEDHLSNQRDGEIEDWSKEVLEKFGHNHDHENETNQRLENDKPKDPARPEWVEQLSHNHDVAEEKNYFDISVKSRLKSALNVMWDAELHLRLYDPSASLPYQYEALKYLEEIKNHARIYVHRIGFDPPAIKEAEKRLSGKLEEARSSTDVITKNQNDELKENVVSLISFLDEYIDDPGEIDEEELELLESVSSSIAAIAIERLELLPVLQNLQNVMHNSSRGSYDKLISLRRELITLFSSDFSEINNQQISLHPLKKAAINSIDKLD